MRVSPLRVAVYYWNGASPISYRCYKADALPIGTYWNRFDKQEHLHSPADAYEHYRIRYGSEKVRLDDSIALGGAPVVIVWLPREELRYFRSEEDCLKLQNAVLDQQKRHQEQQKRDKEAQDKMLEKYR